MVIAAHLFFRNIYRLKDEIIFDNGWWKVQDMINVAANDSFDKIGHYLNVKLLV